MPTCERCWNEAFGRTMAEPGKSQPDHYRDILAERHDDPCSPTQQKYGRFLRCQAEDDCKTEAAYKVVVHDPDEGDYTTYICEHHMTGNGTTADETAAIYAVGQAHHWEEI